VKLYHFTRIGQFVDREGDYEWTADLKPAWLRTRTDGLVDQ
jgi:hypothetical protein